MRRLLGLVLVAVAVTAATAVNEHAPTGVHIAFGTRDDEMSVTWHTLASNPGDPTVEFYPGVVDDVSESSDAPQVSRVEGSTRAFIDGGPERTVRFVHRATLPNLEPGAIYSYRVGNPATKTWSRLFNFCAKRNKSQISPAKPLKLLALCDQGHRESAGVVQLVAAEVADPATRPDALIHCGDFAYDLDTYSGRNGDRWLQDVEPVAAYVPYMTSQGNHERAYNFSHYVERFTMPGHGAHTGNAYYSFDLGPLHVVAFNAEAFFWPEYFDEAYMSRMYEWLVTDLRDANDDRANTPWVMVHGHRPMYCVDPKVPDLTPHANKPEFAGVCGWEKQAVRKGVASECEDEYAALGCSASNARESTRGSSTAARPRRAGGASPEGLWKASGESSGDFPIEKLLFDAGVDLYLAGHVHDYERYFPVYDEHVVNGTDVTLGRYVNPGATVHVTSGSGGNPEMWTDGMYNVSSDKKRPTPRGTCSHRAPWCAFQSGFAPKRTGAGYVYDFTYSRITVHDDETLEWEQVSAPSGALAGDGKKAVGEVIDRFVISAATHGPFASRGEKIATE